jgi:hypothetical protein
VTTSPPLNVVPIGSADPKLDVVDVLQGFLADAEAGQIVDIAVVCIRRDGSMTTDLSIERDAVRILAGVARLAHRINKALDE